jgi:hypothetical protein
LDHLSEKNNILSIITVSHDNFSGLASILSSLQPLFSHGLCWIVQDSGFCKETERFFSELDQDNIKFSNEGDNGIYDALNIAIVRASKYYLVVGSDDIVYPDAILKLLGLLPYVSEELEIIACSVLFRQRVISPKKRLFFPCVSVNGWVSSHSVGTVIKRDLHDRFGWYDVSFTILADSLFLSRCLLGGVDRLVISDLVLGEFSYGGVSTTRHHTRLSEAKDYHVILGYNSFVQEIFLIIRYIKIWARKGL